LEGIIISLSRKSRIAFTVRSPTASNSTFMGLMVGGIFKAAEEISGSEV
jgi:hypothetical protein